MSSPVHRPTDPPMAPCSHASPLIGLMRDISERRLPNQESEPSNPRAAAGDTEVGFVTLTESY
jgi:hypothetical protein